LGEEFPDRVVAREVPPEDGVDVGDVIGREEAIVASTSRLVLASKKAVMKATSPGDAPEASIPARGPAAVSARTGSPIAIPATDPRAAT
jgi:hypothetical protein